MFVCKFVCLYLIQIHISELISTKLCTHLPLCLEETVGYVWSENVWPFSTFLSFFVRSECRILGTTWLLAQDTSATGLYPWFLRVLEWRHIVADNTCPVIRDSVTSMIFTGVIVTSRKWRSCRRHLPRVIRDSVISVILTGVSVTSRKWRCRERHLRVLTGSVVHYG